MKLGLLLLLAFCACSASNAFPAEYEANIVVRDFPHDVEVYGWTDYLEQISATISNVIAEVKRTGEDLWGSLKDAGDKIIDKVKSSMISSEAAAEAFLKDVYPKMVTQLASAVDLGKQELEFLGDLVVGFLKDFGQEAVRLGIKYFEEHQDEIIEEIKGEAKTFFRLYVLKKLRELWVSDEIQIYSMVQYSGLKDFFGSISNAMNKAVQKVKDFGGKLSDSIKDEYRKISAKINAIVAPITAKVEILLKVNLPKLVQRAKEIIYDAKERAVQVGKATLEMLKEMGHDALVEAKKWIEEHHEEIEKLLFEFLVEVLPKLIQSAVRDQYSSWTDFWKKIGNAIDKAVSAVKETGQKLSDKIKEEYNKIANKVNAIVAPIRNKVEIILRTVMPKIAEKAKLVIRDAKELARQVGKATLDILKRLGHDALIEAKKWLQNNRALIEKFLYEFLTEELPKYIKEALGYSVVQYNGWTDFWEKVGKAIDDAVDTVKETGAKLADKISEQFDKIKDKVNEIIAPIKEKVKIIMEDIMPKLAEKAKIIFHDAKELAEQVGQATLEILQKLGHDALVEAKKWLEENHELVEKLLFQFLTEQLPKLIEQAISFDLSSYNGWTDFWEKVGKAIDDAVETVKETGEKLADKISEQFDKIKDKVNEIVAPIKAKVRIIMEDIMPKIAEKAKIIFHDAKQLAEQVGKATLEILQKLGHDALVEAKKWLEENHELVEKLLFQFLTEQLPKLILQAVSYEQFSLYNGWSDFWEKVGKAIDNAVEKVKETGAELKDKISEQFDKIKDKVNEIVAPIKAKVQIIMEDVMPKLAEKAKILFHDAKELARQVGKATLEILQKLGHDALIEAQKWLEANHELVEKLLFQFLTEQLPKLIEQAISSDYEMISYNGWTDFWEKVGKAIDNAVQNVKEKGEKLADKISEQFEDLKEKVNQIIAPIKAKVRIIMEDIMPKIADKAKIIFHDAKELAKQVGQATLEILKKLGHDALIEAEKWLKENHELVEKLLFQFLTEQLPKLIEQAIGYQYGLIPYNGWTDFWEKVGKAIDTAVEKVKETGAQLGDKISEQFDKIKDKVNEIIAPIKAKVKIIMEDIMPQIAEKAKIIFHDAKELAKQVGKATLEILQKLGHDALVEAKKWLEENHELVEKLLFEFLTEQLPKLIEQAISSDYEIISYNGWTDFWEKVGKAIDDAVQNVKDTGAKLADKIAEQFNKFKDQVNQIIAPIKAKVKIIMEDIMPKIADKAKIIFHDAKQLAKQVGQATLELLKQLGHDALVEAQNWLEKNHELVEKLLFEFLTEQLPKLIGDLNSSF